MLPATTGWSGQCGLSGIREGGGIVARVDRNHSALSSFASRDANGVPVKAVAIQRSAATLCKEAAGFAGQKPVGAKKKTPPEGMGGVFGSNAEAPDLGGAASTTKSRRLVDRSIGCRLPARKRALGKAAMQIHACGQKKRLQPKLEPDDRAEAKSKVRPKCREEDCTGPVNLGRGRRIRLRFGVASRGSEGGGNGAAFQRQGEI
jgi:hypothetical protein